MLSAYFLKALTLYKHFFLRRNTHILVKSDCGLSVLFVSVYCRVSSNLFREKIIQKELEFLPQSLTF